MLPVTTTSGPLFTEIVYGAAPPPTVAVICPSPEPLQVMSLSASVTVGSEKTVSTALAVAVAPKASFTTTV